MQRVMNIIGAVVVLSSIAGGAFFLDDRHAPSGVVRQVEILEVQDEKVLKLSELSARQISNELEKKLLEEKLESYLIEEQVRQENNQPIEPRQHTQRMIIERKIERLENERNEIREDRQHVIGSDN